MEDLVFILSKLDRFTAVHERIVKLVDMWTAAVQQLFTIDLTNLKQKNVRHTLYFYVYCFLVFSSGRHYTVCFVTKYSVHGFLRTTLYTNFAIYEPVHSVPSEILSWKSYPILEILSSLEILILSSEIL